MLKVHTRGIFEVQLNESHILRIKPIDTRKERKIKD